MDPDQTLREVLEALALHDQTSSSAHTRIACRVTIVTRLRQLRDWTYQGGHPPTWPQGPLTQEQVNELTRAGHQP
jgi:hypothetical protein